MARSPAPATPFVCPACRAFSPARELSNANPVQQVGCTRGIMRGLSVSPLTDPLLYQARHVDSSWVPGFGANKALCNPGVDCNFAVLCPSCEVPHCELPQFQVARFSNCIQFSNCMSVSNGKCSGQRRHIGVSNRNGRRVLCSVNILICWAREDPA